MVAIQGLYFGYPQKASLFSDLHLELPEGHIYGLLGKNGAGKSTLLKIIAGLVFPKKGSCLFSGADVSSRPVAVLEDLYFIPEEIYVPSLTPEQFFSNTAGFYPKFDRANFYQYLQALGIDDKTAMDKQSYGQQKKAMIAFGLATGTSLLIMDEPTNGLDIPSKVQFRKLIASIQTENRCIVISTHQVRDLDSLIDTLLILHEQEIVLNSSLDTITEKLTFGSFQDTAGLPVLYEEESIRGKNAILRNSSGSYSRMDMELLFNAIISGDKSFVESIKNLLK